MSVTVPSWPEFSIPVLQALASGEVVPRRKLVAEAIAIAGLTDAQQAETVKSGQKKAVHRAGWAASFLFRIDALSRPTRGHYQITEMGRALLAKHPEGISEAIIRSHAKPGDEWWIPKKESQASEVALGEKPDLQSEEPIELIERGINQIHNQVAAELLSRLREQEPEFFEQTVIELLLKMGYGGVHGRGSITQLSHDGGIDGVIDQDALGLNKVYVQAKRYASTNTVQRPEVQSFVGALSGIAEGGLMITTSTFSKGATEYAHSVPARIILIDGNQLVQLMIRYGVGVEVKETYNVVAVDEDFFL